MLSSLLSGPEISFLMAVLKYGGGSFIFFIMFFICAKMWSRIQVQDSTRIDLIINMADKRWSQKIDQDSKEREQVFMRDAQERERQYELYKGLLDNVSAHTGELASINTKLDHHGRAIEEVKDAFGVIHARFDRILDGRSINGSQSIPQNMNQRETV